MSIHMMSFTGTAPFGSLWGGVAATHLGAPTTVLIGGSLCLVAAVAYASQLRSVRPAEPTASPPDETAPAGGALP
jgi:predicted MFS family arabinose efflux permease